MQTETHIDAKVRTKCNYRARSEETIVKRVVSKVIGRQSFCCLAALVLGISSTRTVRAAEPAAGSNYMGIGINNPGNGNAPLYADVMMSAGSPTQIGSSTLAPVDANGWPTSDAQWYLIDGSTVKNITGTYQLRFNGQATIGFQFGGMAVVPGTQSYNSSTNTTTATISCTSTTTIVLQLSNTKRTAGSATNSGVTNVQLMRPTAVGSTTAYSFGTVFTSQIETIAGKFHALRFMDFKATNSNGDVAWSDRVLPLAAGHNAPTDGSGNSLYGWQGMGGAWEYAVRMANETNCDMWINIPAKANSDYITKVAQLIRYGSDGVNPYTSTQSNPVFSPLNSNLKVYVEYSNEVWNTSYGFRQSTDNYNLAQSETSAGGSPLNYDGATGWTLAWRRVGNQIVNISNAFRSVWGDSNMMTRVRPVLEWQYGDGQTTGSTELGFIDNWYNNGDGNHVSTPHSVNYFIWGGGSAAYYNPVNNNSDTMTVSQILSESDPTVRTTQWDYMKTDIGLTTMFGLKRAAYEGGLGLGDDPSHSLAAKQATLTNSGLQSVVKNAQNMWSNYGGDLLMYFESGEDVGYGHTDSDFSTSTQKLQAIDSLRSSAKATPTLGVAVPGSIDGNNWQVNSRGWGTPGAGALSSFGTVANSYGVPAINSVSYMVRVAAGGTYYVKVNYSSTVSTNLKISAVGNNLGTATINNTSGNPQDSATYTATLNAGLNGIRLQAVIGSPNFTINSVTISSTGSSGYSARYFPRSGFASRMTGGTFQGSNDNSNWTTLSTISGTPTDGAWSNNSLGGTNYRYWRYVSPASGWGNIAELQFLNGGTTLTGTGFGTAGSWNNYGNTFSMALDGNTTTFFDAPIADYAFVGLDTGASTGTPVALTNPGFETGNTNGWLGGGTVYGVNNASPHSGSYNSFNNGGWNSIYQTVNGLSPNSSYTMKVWARLGNSVTGNNQNVYVNNNGVYSSAWITSTTYTQYTINFTTGSNTSVQIGNSESNGSNAIAYTDDYTLTKN